jgi:hypothetical protein
MKFSVTKNGELLDTKLYSWDPKIKTFCSNEDGLVLDFSNIDGVTFKTDSYCTFKTGNYCTFTTGFYCTFTIDGKEIEISNESFNNLKKQLCKEINNGTI